MIFNTTTPEQVEKLLADNPEQHIPQGVYCHSSGDTRSVCPFWDYDDELPEQENGYCHFLKISDFQENPIRCQSSKIIRSRNPEDIGKTVSEFFETDHIPMSLLWDQCKECGVNPEDPPDIELVTTTLNDNDRLQESSDDIV